MDTPNKICLVCSKNYTVKPYLVTKSKYCSMKCKYNMRKIVDRIDCNCKFCNKKFNTAKSSNRKFCSTICFRKNNKAIKYNSYYSF